MTRSQSPGSPAPDPAAQPGSPPAAGGPAGSSGEAVRLLVKAVGMLPDGERDEVYTWLLSRGLSTAYADRSPARPAARRQHPDPVPPGRGRPVGATAGSSGPVRGRAACPASRLVRRARVLDGDRGPRPGGALPGGAASRPQLAAAIRLRLVARLVAVWLLVGRRFRVQAGRGCRAPGAAAAAGLAAAQAAAGHGCGTGRCARAGRSGSGPGGAAAAPGLALRRSLTCGRPYPGGPGVTRALADAGRPRVSQGN